MHPDPRWACKKARMSNCFSRSGLLAAAAKSFGVAKDETVGVGVTVSAEDDDGPSALALSSRCSFRRKSKLYEFAIFKPESLKQPLEKTRGIAKAFH
jgi:hypothetical protein